MGCKENSIEKFIAVNAYIREERLQMNNPTLQARNQKKNKLNPKLVERSK